ncbi:MAG: hypothetical protein R3B72_29475 [Polyangiaceae bacterium]
MKLSTLFPAALTLCLMGAFMASPGCGRQGEGERCDADNNDDDCADGLICRRGTDLGRNADVCCPEDVAAATAIDCIPASDGSGGSDPTTSSTGGASGTGGMSAGGAGGMGGSSGGAGGMGGSGGTGGGTGGMSAGGNSAGGSGGA